MAGAESIDDQVEDYILKNFLDLGIMVDISRYLLFDILYHTLLKKLKITRQTFEIHVASISGQRLLNRNILVPARWRMSFEGSKVLYLEVHILEDVALVDDCYFDTEDPLEDGF